MGNANSQGAPCALRNLPCLQEPQLRSLLVTWNEQWWLGYFSKLQPRWDRALSTCTPVLEDCIHRMNIRLELTKHNGSKEIDKNKAFCGNNFSEFFCVNMGLLLNWLRQKINLYRNKQEECSRKYLNNQGHVLHSWFLHIVWIYH